MSPFIIVLPIITMIIVDLLCKAITYNIFEHIGEIVASGIIAFIASIFISICAFLYALENANTYNASKSTISTVESVGGKHIQISGRYSDIYVFTKKTGTIDKVYPDETVVDILAEVPYIENRVMCNQGTIATFIINEEDVCVDRKVLHTKSLDL